MDMQLSLIGFDYSVLPEDRREIATSGAYQIKALAKRTAQDIIEIGRLLTEVKTAIGHGNFMVWTQAEFGWSQMQTARFMRVYDKFNIMLNLDNIAPTALYKLSEPGTPDRARAEAVRLAQDGEYVSVSKADEIIAEYKTDRALYSSDTNEWYTPRHLLQRVIETMGGIDLDPCSNPGNPNVPAKEYYTPDIDGLSQVWRGRVFVNPPYGREIEDWVKKTVDEFRIGSCTEAVLLVPSRTDTGWFRMLVEYPRCFIWGRIKFIDENGAEGSPAPFPSMAVYLGGNTLKFYNAFKDVGDVYSVVRF